MNMSWNDDIEPEVSTREVEEIPWGPGWLYLQKALKVEVEEDHDRGTVTVVAKDLGVHASGDDYDAAVEELGFEIEQQWDDLTSERLLMPAAAERLAKLRGYIGG